MSGQKTLWSLSVRQCHLTRPGPGERPGAAMKAARSAANVRSIPPRLVADELENVASVNHLALKQHCRMLEDRDLDQGPPITPGRLAIGSIVMRKPVGQRPARHAHDAGPPGADEPPGLVIAVGSDFECPAIDEVHGQRPCFRDDDLGDT
jgi:hypothetical protein